MSTGDVWQIGLAGVAIVVSVVLYRANRNTRSIGVAVLTSRPLIGVRHRFNVEVLLDGSRVEAPRLVVLRLVNSGSEAIRTDEIEEQITVNAGSGRILSLDVTLARPTSFQPSLILDQHGVVTLEPCLVNPRDMIELQMLVDGDFAPNVSARIAGISAIGSIKVSRTSWDEPWRVSKGDWVILSALPISVSIIAVMTLVGDSPYRIWIGLGLLIFAWVGMPWQFSRLYRRNSLVFGEK